MNTMNTISTVKVNKFCPVALMAERRCPLNLLETGENQYHQSDKLTPPHDSEIFEWFLSQPVAESATEQF